LLKIQLRSRIKKFNSGVKFDHSSSMKEFQLSHPNLQDWAGPHDVLLLDEAQDMNPCMLADCLQQKVPTIVVGDQHQHICSFRGAVNALDLVMDGEQPHHSQGKSFPHSELQVWIRDCLTGKELLERLDGVR
jgi:F-box protein 18 (helicase)